MKKTASLLIALTLLILYSCQSKKENEVYEPKTLELIKLVEKNPEIKELLLASIEHAKALNPDKKTNPAQMLEDYYVFVSKSENAMPWRFIDLDYTEGLYAKIDQSLCYFFYINDQPLEALEGKGYFNNSLQYHEPYKSWLTSFNKAYGDFMNTEVSWNENYYQIGFLVCKMTGMKIRPTGRLLMNFLLAF